MHKVAEILIIIFMCHRKFRNNHFWLCHLEQGTQYGLEGRELDKFDRITITTVGLSFVIIKCSGQPDRSVIKGSGLYHWQTHWRWAIVPVINRAGTKVTVSLPISSFDSVVRLNHQKPSSTALVVLTDYPFIWINLLFYYGTLMACIEDRRSFDV